MGYKTKVQLIRRKESNQFYVNFPSACAQMLDLKKGEEVEWTINDKGELRLKRLSHTDKKSTGGE